MSSIIRARNGDMVVSFRWWSAEQSPARRHQQNTPIRHHPDFTTPALGDSRSVQLQFLDAEEGDLGESLRRPLPFPVKRIEDRHRFSTLAVCHVLIRPIALEPTLSIAIRPVKVASEMTKANDGKQPC